MVDIIVVGGGASGMTAALSAARAGASVTLLERQARVGRKLLSTGNGRCNLTNVHASPEHYHGEDAAFCAHALESFSPRDTLKFFEELGLMTVEEYGGRVFPLSGQAASVLDILRFAVESAGVKVMTGSPALGVSERRGVFEADCGENRLRSRRLIIACGGCAGAKLGGVTDGYSLLKPLGHSRTALRPALTQIRTEPDYPRALKGVRAQANVTIIAGGRKIAENYGEVLFTDTGVSGTAAFEISRAVGAENGAEVSLDFFEGRGSELRRHLTAMREMYPDMPANGILTGTVHNRLGQMLCKYAGLGAQTRAGDATDEQLQALYDACRGFRLKITGVSGFETAQVTAGGVRTSEFCAQTLESRLVPGLYACGEVLDVDGDCGGYNLQWAWSSGMLAGENAAC